MKHFKIVLLSLTLVLQSYSLLFAQQGSVAAGGDASGAGGSMSFSIGQVDFQVYSGAQGSLSLGIQQGFASIPGVPENLVISSTTISSGELLCYNALQVITTGGNGNHFIVEAGGSVDLIAGERILMKPGTKVNLQGQLHARISNDWCQPPPAMLAAEESTSSFANEISAKIFVAGNFFSLYPNPTSGVFYLDFTEEVASSDLNIEVYSAQGKLILKKALPGQKNHSINISHVPAGIYLIRVIKDNNPGFGKIIKQ